MDVDLSGVNPGLWLIAFVGCVVAAIISEKYRHIFIGAIFLGIIPFFEPEGSPNLWVPSPEDRRPILPIFFLMMLSILSFIWRSENEQIIFMKKFLMKFLVTITAGIFLWHFGFRNDLEIIHIAIFGVIAISVSFLPFGAD